MNTNQDLINWKRKEGIPLNKADLKFLEHRKRELTITLKLRNGIKLTRAEAALLGGRANHRKHGPKHMRKIARKGGRTLHEKYQLTPTDLYDFALVDRSTGEIKAYLSGKPVQPGETSQAEFPWETTTGQLNPKFQTTRRSTDD